MSDFLQTNPLVETAVWIAGIGVLAWLANSLTRRYLLRVISRVVAQTRFTWDDIIFDRKVFGRLAHIAPAVVVYYGVAFVPGMPANLLQLAQRVAMGFMVLVVVLSVDRLLTALNDIYSLRPDAKSRPIKGYLQILKIALYVAAGIVVISTLVGRPPTLILGGFGAMTAVLLLVFKDTILSLVASIQITQYNMVAVGDWIEMPKYGADGDVIDIALHTVTIQNWDKTITTVPTHKLIEDSFKNWRGMSRSGGRRIKRSLYLDVSTIRFLEEEEITRLGRFELLKAYMRDKLEEVGMYNALKAQGDPNLTPNTRRLTNVGTLRAYIVAYLRQHPKIHQDMTLIVRQLQPGPEGLPIEIYAFSNDTDWSNYEGLQADIFDHIFAMVPEFGLRVFQKPSGRDLEALSH
ncbi:MAG: mechanosensitive ion channel family protein [Longimicrobiales bacterium]|nr:mechanosensitive ion channel family protein [Longimicrobiales bacterium]